MNKHIFLIKAVILIFFMAGCHGCSKSVQVSDDAKTHEYDYILEQFNTDLSKLGHGSIDFAGLVILKQPIDQSALCISGIKAQRGGRAMIVIDSNKTAVMNNVSMMKLIYHEIGHCYLGLSHGASGLMKADSFITVTSQQMQDESMRLILLNQMVIDSGMSF